MAISYLNVCSNKLVGGGNIIGIKDFAPLIVGFGEIPQLWIYHRLNNSNWQPIVLKNESCCPDTSVEISDIERRVKTILLLCGKQTKI